MSALSPSCTGTWCELKSKCARYDPMNANQPNSNYLAGVPYDPIKKECPMFRGFKTDLIIKTLEHIHNQKDVEN